MNNFSQSQFSQHAPMHFITSLKAIFRDNWMAFPLCCLSGMTIGFSIDMLKKNDNLYRAEIVFDVTGGRDNGSGTPLSSAFGAGMAINENLLSGENFFYFVKSRLVLERTLMKIVKIKGNSVLLANLFIDSSGVKDEKWKKDLDLHNFRFKAVGVEALDIKSRIALNNLVSEALKSTQITSLGRKSSFKKLSVSMKSSLLAALWCSTLLKTIEEVYAEKQSEKALKVLLLYKNREDSLARLITIKQTVLALEKDKSSYLTTQEAKIMTKKLQRESDFLQDLSFTTISETEQMRMALVGKEPLFVTIEGVSYPVPMTPISQKGTMLGSLTGIIAAIIFVCLKISVYGSRTRIYLPKDSLPK
ncbi:hypothetical protein ACFP1I_08325 [Dyadobacter subterraneus]|uniref:Tyrosine kinase G-rich domain-containing protein n=1 Tax=Dyadobacter subterraneus TaxID=2773304 RepID=A0ABR9WED5_9BACT|nr:hypothetical protein [Dyadobacter subterraneus]MBE9463859.1 hypothetical protein [Dyadobacter subterraneus]